MAEGKLDLAKAVPPYYKAKGEPALVELPELTFLTVEGEGDPRGEAFQEAVAALYGAAFGIKMDLKKRTGQDYKVMSLEGLWWADYDKSLLENPDELWKAPREYWRYKLLIMTPGFVTEGDLARTIEAGRKKGKPGIARVKLERIHEGLAVQALYVGPYATEPETIGKMVAFMEANHLQPRGLHHEIYLSDPRRTAPEKNKTILRQPVVQR